MRSRLELVLVVVVHKKRAVQFQTGGLAGMHGL